MKYNVKNKLKAVFAVIAAMLALMLLCATVSADANEVGKITSVELTKSQSEVAIEISLTKEYVKANKPATMYIFELLPHESTSAINSMEPVKEFKIAEKTTVKLPFYNGNMTRLYSKFVVAEKADDGTYNIITAAKYVENVSALAKNTEAYPERPSKKGLQVQMFTDAQQLGVAHTVVNVPINEYLHGESCDAAQSFVYNGQTFYVDSAKIALLDHKVKTYTDAGINVYFNIILTAPTENAHPNIASLYCEGVSADATLYALNTKNETAMKSYQAFMDYLASRYTREDRAYGFVPAFIVGFEVNSNRVWNNAGDVDMTNYIYSYCTAFRVAYTAMTSHYANGRVYISLGNNFNAAASDLSVTANSLQDYPAKAFLDTFASVIKNAGDIPWGLSINPHPSTPGLTEFWNDEYATDDFETPFITMKNLGTLTRYMSEEALLYNSEIRSIIVGEFGLSGDPSSDESMTMQAAAYALAYYALAQNDDIDAFIYHRHVDHSAEAQYYGLWTNVPDSTVEPLAKKPIYNVFSLIDTQKSEEVTAFVKHTVGTGAFDMFMAENVKYKQFNDRTVFEGVRAESEDFKRGYKEKVLFDLTEGKLCDFYPTDGAQYVELRSFGDASETMLYAKLPDIPNGYTGIGNSVFDEGAINKAHYITLRIMVATPSDVGSMNLMLRLQENGGGERGGALYEGEVTVTPNVWNDVSFNIKDFSAKTDGELDLLKLWVSNTDSDSAIGEYGIRLESVTLQVKRGIGVIGWIFIVLLILVALVVGAYGALFLRARYIRKKRREAAMLRRQEMMRTQQMQRGQMQYPPQNRQ